MFFLGFIIQAAVLAILVFAIGGEHASNDMGRMMFLMIGIGVGSLVAGIYLPETIALVAVGALAIFLIYTFCHVTLKRALLIVVAFTAITFVTDAALAVLTQT